jgi:RNA polymerase sigma factor (sigma-70 family)
MGGLKSGAILRQMQVLLGAGTFSGLSDGELLERFLERRDEIAELAFAVLVERHGPMVLGVCRRIIRDPHDAEDAFQATFLVLARKGRSVRVQGSLGRWLFGVATRVATRARSDQRRRRARERSGLDRVETAEVDASLTDPDRAEILAVIAREVAGLPARFQAPVLLCDLEGTSCEEAARRLGWPVGTVKSRLSRARSRLRERLTRRGLTPADLSIVNTMLSAAPSHGLVEATTRAALTVISGRLMTSGVVSASVAILTQGVLQTMIATRIKLAAAALLLVAIGSAALFGQASAQRSEIGRVGQTPGAATARTTATPASDDQVDLEMLERAWADAVARRDTTVVNRILADDFEGIDQLGATVTKATYMADVAHGRFAPEDQLVDTKIRLFGETGVVITRILSKSSGSQNRSTKVYARRGGRWQCVALHAGAAHGAAFGAAAREEWRKALDEWMKFNAADKANCMSCHTVNVHPEPLRAQLPAAADQGSCTSCHMANVHQNDRLRDSGGPHPPIQLDRLTSIYSPFVCRVVKIRVGVGEGIKKGDPLLELFSADLAAAKTDYEVALSQWNRDKRLYDQRKVLAESNAVSKEALLDAENGATKSRLQMNLARDRLLMYGLTDDEITNLGKEPDGQRARFTIRSRGDGIVAAVGAVLGNHYDRKDVLIRIRPNPPRY